MTLHADSMIDRTDSAGTVGATIRKRLQGVSIGRIVVVVSAVLIQAILILGFVAMSLGLGADGAGGVGPDRPPPPAQIP